MLKYSSLILLVAIAVFWSSAGADAQGWRYSAIAPVKRSLALAARHAAPYKRGVLAYSKRETEVSDEDSSEESREEFLKRLIVAFLVMSVDDSAEQDTLATKLLEALDSKWDSLDKFEEHVLKVYEEVTGTKLSELNESDE